MSRNSRRRRTKHSRGGRAGSTLALLTVGFAFIGAATFAFRPAAKVSADHSQMAGRLHLDEEKALRREARSGEAEATPSSAASLNAAGTTAPGASPQLLDGERRIASFTLCRSGGGTNCVVDGDTAWIGGTKVRIADIDAPETHPSRCALEAELGEKATLRLQELLNAGPFELQVPDRATDRYGRALRIIVRDDQSIGNQLISEGLARPWEGARQPWC